MGISATTFFSNEQTSLELSSECIEQGKIRDELFNQRIMEDIISSFNLDIDTSYDRFTFRDLEASHLLYGGREDDTHYQSLAKLFQNLDVSTRGTPRLFVRPHHAYFLYKETSNTNVMVELKLEENQWVVLEQRKVPGSPVEYEQLKCEIAYLKKAK
ncbi:hypothetical protein DS745_02350 [Anaerobacillus alkaliphilus]|uniref:Uncharacterized protein n=2 Tax=Anaerobacillus alkaliphilus TaxID=1548597 RepID=A0A4Q0W0E0_9BACI|nr:hypothetical protein DS745_02350 [Anaerobacillus alkaliphilus]